MDDAEVEAPDSIQQTLETELELEGTPKKHKVRDYSYTQNRELSWLQFDRRVLEEALDPSTPLLERLKFVSIFSTNLDEFFMVRVGSLTDLSIIAPDDREDKSNMSPSEQLDAIFAATKPLIKERDKIYEQVTAELQEVGFDELDLTKLPKKERKFARDYYRDFIKPVLSPQVVDERHPFPHLKNKELYIVTLLSEEDGSQHLGIVNVPENIAPIIAAPDDPLRFVRAEKLIAYHIAKIFDIYETSEPIIISVTRNADISFDEEKFSDDESDYRLHVSRLLKKRNRLNPVRLEIEGKPDKVLVAALLKRLKLSKMQAYTSNAPINLGWVFGLEKRIDPELCKTLCYPPFAPRASREFDLSRSIIEQVEERDRLLFYPYDSMDPFLRLLQEAANDPDVVSIKITVYRLASDSRVAQHLAEAAENGKDVTVLMELRARFDEANNIDWAGRLEEAGCNIIYGMENYKCHSKACLITKRKNGRITNITQIGTGNYNEKTAKLYTDLSLITADEAIGRDAVEFFQNMLIGNLKGTYDELLVAPKSIKRTILKLIDREIEKGVNGRVTLKCNSITERDIIDRLAEASQAGVQVRMNVRGICCLLPDVAGKTDNIHVISIVGQFLEHSRIFTFGEGDDLEMFIGSADLMTRNLVHRVEVACPIKSPAIRNEILLFLEKIFEDNTKARTLESNGDYVKLQLGHDKELCKLDTPFCLHDWCINHPLQEEGKHFKAPVTVAQPEGQTGQQELAKPASEAQAETDAGQEETTQLRPKEESAVNYKPWLDAARAAKAEALAASNSASLSDEQEGAGSEEAHEAADLAQEEAAEEPKADAKLDDLVAQATEHESWEDFLIRIEGEPEAEPESEPNAESEPEPEPEPAVREKRPNLEAEFELGTQETVAKGEEIILDTVLPNEDAAEPKPNYDAEFELNSESSADLESRLEQKFNQEIELDIQPDPEPEPEPDAVAEQATPQASVLQPAVPAEVVLEQVGTKKALEKERNFANDAPHIPPKTEETPVEKPAAQDVPAEQPPKKKGFFKRLFGK